MWHGAMPERMTIEAQKDPAPDDLTATEYPVGRVEALTGIASATLRVWERRYGRPVAHRRPSGHRRYDREQVRWLRRVAEALACGHRPGSVVRMSDAELDALLRPQRGASDDPELAAWLGLVKTCRRDDLVRSLDEALATAESTGTVCGWIDSRLAILLHRVGQEWAAGRLDIRHEHLATDAVDDVLRAARPRIAERAATAARSVTMLLASLPGERHRLGLQMVALASASLGVTPVVLGDDSPLEEIVAASRETGAAIVGLGTSLGPAGTRAARLVVDLRVALPDDVALVVGGSGARLRRLPGVSTVSSLDEFRRWLESFTPRRSARDESAA